MSTDDFKPLTPREQALVAGWTAEVERLREAIEQACYALDPNQGERPSPSLAYKWLRTTFPPDHPNYVAREAVAA